MDCTGLSYHICGKLEVALKVSPSSQHQHCTDEAQKAETVLSAVRYIYIIYIYIYTVYNRNKNNFRLFSFTGRLKGGEIRDFLERSETF